MVDHPTTGGCKAASILRNKRATDFLNLSVGEATDARHLKHSSRSVERYKDQRCTNSPDRIQKLLCHTAREADSLPYKGWAIIGTCILYLISFHIFFPLGKSYLRGHSSKILKIPGKFSKMLCISVSM